MKIYIQSESKNIKKFIIEEKGKNTEIAVKKDMVSCIMSYLSKNNLTLSDFDEFIGVETKSFTGTRENFLIANTFNYFVKNFKVEDLKYPKYHKEPNIGKPKKSFGKK